MSVTYPPEMLPASDDLEDVSIVVDGKELTLTQAEQLMTPTDALIEKMARGHRNSPGS